MAVKALTLGAWAVVVGTDITGIDLKVQQYVQTLKATTIENSQP